MWPFDKKVDKKALQQVKAVKVQGWQFRIKRINPLLDFTASNMPQIFSDFVSRRKPTEMTPLEAYKKSREDMESVIVAGVVEPKIVPAFKGVDRGKEEDITVDDLFRVPDLAQELYWEILAHSMNRFGGLRGVFFSITSRFRRSIALRRSTASVLATSSSAPGNSA